LLGTKKTLKQKLINISLQLNFIETAENAEGRRGKKENDNFIFHKNFELLDICKLPLFTLCSLRSLRLNKNQEV
jgi:hypothetical protein